MEKNRYSVTMPKLGESVTEGTLVRWLVKLGDKVDKYDNIAEIETAKVVAEVPVTVAGVVSEILCEEGETLPVGSVLCILETYPEAEQPPQSSKAEAIKVAATTAPGATKNTTLSTNPAATSSTYLRAQGSDTPADPKSSGVMAPDAGGAQLSAISGAQVALGRYSPAVRALAVEHNLNLSTIKGTGVGGRVTRKDVLAVLADASFAPASPAMLSPTTGPGCSSPQGSELGATPDDALKHANSDKKLSLDHRLHNSSHKTSENLSENPLSSLLQARPEVKPAAIGAKPSVTVSAASIANFTEDTKLPVDPIRKAIAKKMVESVSNIPHAWLTLEVDATNLVNFRDHIKNAFRASNAFPITYFAFFVSEVVKALKTFPLLNSVWKDDYILLKKDINICIAVAVENNLFVPVIRQANNKTITEIAYNIHDLATRAKTGGLTMDDMEGGTFTVNNTGSIGSVSSMGIINYPQAGILQIESIVKRPVVLGGNSIAIRDIVNISLSIDHRIIDGLVAGQFLQQVKRNVENISYSLEDF